MSSSLRLLIVTHAPLSPDHGAAQVALNLGDALRVLGHDATIWSPHPLTARRGWRSGLSSMRVKLERFIGSQPRFDVIDAPASLISSRIRRQPLVIVRSVQPDLKYLFTGLLEGLDLSASGCLHFLSRSAQSCYQGFLVLQGWRRADFIICQGESELRWMKRYIPIWGGKLRSYVPSLSDGDQAQLSVVRSKRSTRETKQQIRFLWIGRWARHKGNVELLEFAKKWLSERPQDCFTIAGCGPIHLPPDTSALLESGRIRVVPSYTRENLPTLLANHDVGLFTSRVEGWGLALNEMLESGMPVFATLAGGVSDLGPYFGRQLSPFPPTITDIERTRAAKVDWVNYYAKFNWRAIAKKYLDSVSGVQVF